MDGWIFFKYLKVEQGIKIYDFTMSGTGQKSLWWWWWWVGWWVVVCKPTLVLSLGQAEQYDLKQFSLTSQPYCTVDKKIETVDTG